MKIGGDGGPTRTGPALDFDAARAAVARVARLTPLLESPELSDAVGAPVLLKLESLQVTGSFKVRGAAARLAALTAEERQVGVVTCSSGNHGRAVAHAARRLGIPATICVPDWVDPVKLEGIRASGAEAVLAGPTYDEAEAHALALARDTGRPFVSAYDDPWIMAGQGTLALEVLDALDDPPRAFLVPLSGGGLVGGIAAALRQRLGDEAPATVAVTAERARVMLASLEAGHPVELPEETTVASALSGGIGLENRYSFAAVRDLVDEHVVVTEEEIRAAMAFAATTLHVVAEGGGAVGIAALRSGRWSPAEGTGAVVVVVSGGNVAPSTLADVLSGAS
ncbi:MAG: pyridoxal-phosphate dependent enzyme [Gemmatimonadota bacterium]|jgi:threonine dehydratase